MAILEGFELLQRLPPDTVDWKTSDAIIVCGPPYIGTEGG